MDQSDKDMADILKRIEEIKSCEMPPVISNKPKTTRKKTTDRDYGWKHQQFRKQKLREQPICEICLENWSTIAHHLIRPAKSANDYQAVCKPCHDRIHNEQ